jgi:hypothetical protein
MTHRHDPVVRQVKQGRKRQRKLKRVLLFVDDFAAVRKHTTRSAAQAAGPGEVMQLGPGSWLHCGEAVRTLLP